jgi:hypothetical protein
MISRKGYSDYENGLTYSPARGFYSQATGQRTQSSAPGTLGGYASGAIFDDEDAGMNGMTNAASRGAGAGIAYRKGKAELLGMPQFQPGSPERQAVSGMINPLPYVGQAKMLYEAITGNDDVAGCRLGNGTRIINGGLSVLPIAGAVLEKAGAAGIEAGAAKSAGALTAGAKETGLGLLASRTVKVSEKGLALVENHLLQFGPDAANAAMIARLRTALQEGRAVSGADAVFYTHEAYEATLMGRGMGWDAAHAAALAKYNVSPFAVYHPEVITRFPDHFSPGYGNFWKSN